MNEDSPKAHEAVGIDDKDSSAAQRRFNLSMMQAMEAIAAQVNALNTRIIAMANQANAETISQPMQTAMGQIADLKVMVERIEARLDQKLSGVDATVGELAAHLEKEVGSLNQGLIHLGDRIDAGTKTQEEFGLVQYALESRLQELETHCFSVPAAEEAWAVDLRESLGELCEKMQNGESDSDAPSESAPGVSTDHLRQSTRQSLENLAKLAASSKKSGRKNSA